MEVEMTCWLLLRKMVLGAGKMAQLFKARLTTKNIRKMVLDMRIGRKYNAGNENWEARMLHSVVWCSGHSTGSPEGLPTAGDIG